MLHYFFPAQSTQFCAYVHAFVSMRISFFWHCVKNMYLTTKLISLKIGKIEKSKSSCMFLFIMRLQAFLFHFHFLKTHNNSPLTVLVLISFCFYYFVRRYDPRWVFEMSMNVKFWSLCIQIVAIDTRFKLNLLQM